MNDDGLAWAVCDSGTFLVHCALSANGVEGLRSFCRQTSPDGMTPATLLLGLQDWGAWLLWAGLPSERGRAWDGILTRWGQGGQGPRLGCLGCLDRLGCLGTCTHWGGRGLAAVRILARFVHLDLESRKSRHRDL